MGLLNNIKSIFYKVKEKDGYKVTRILCFKFKKQLKSKSQNILGNLKEIELMEVHIPNMKYIGKQTYAHPTLFVANADTKIGSFCSIAPNVILGHGNHPLNFLSTSPYFYFDNCGYKNKEMVSHNEYWYYAPIEIGNDVWIGDGVFIKNGLKIGDGAVIGAKSLVTKDVPPYAIVAGSPAKILRYRFEKEIIAELLDLKWWDLDDNIIKKIPYDNIDKSLDFLRWVKNDKK